MRKYGITKGTFECRQFHVGNELKYVLIIIENNPKPFM